MGYPVPCSPPHCVKPTCFAETTCDKGQAPVLVLRRPQGLEYGRLKCECGSHLKSSMSRLVWNFPASPMQVQMFGLLNLQGEKNAMNNGNNSLPAFFKDSKEIHKTACFLSRKEERYIYFDRLSVFQIPLIISHCFPNTTPNSPNQEDSFIGYPSCTFTVSIKTTKCWCCSMSSKAMFYFREPH